MTLHLHCLTSNILHFWNFDIYDVQLLTGIVEM